MIKNSIYFTFIALTVFTLGCSNDSNNNSTSIPDEGNEIVNMVAGSARYKVTFNATWSAASHPTNFPGNPHFSGLVGAVHNNDTSLWQSGQTASLGIESMAETGSKAVLLTEIDNIINSGDALSRLSGGGIGTSPNAVSMEFDISPDYPLVSLVSMLAPSPDWFIGVSGMTLLENEAWLQSKTINLRLYDSGTDNGQRFTSANSNTNPKQNIGPVTTAASDTDFVNGEAFVGTFTFERIDNL